MRLFALQSPQTRESLTMLGLDKPDETKLATCQERVTAEMLTCVDRAATIEQAVACQPDSNLRPANARRTPEECEQYVRHVGEIVNQAPPSKAAAENMVEAARKECAGWLTLERFDGVMRGDDLARVGRVPALNEMPVGAFAAPSFPKPIFSVYEARKHAWVSVPEDIGHMA